MSEHSRQDLKQVNLKGVEWKQIVLIQPHTFASKTVEILHTTLAVITQT